MIGMQMAEMHHRGELMKHLYLSLGSWLLTAPLDLFEHHTISWMTPIWSMLTIPVISIILYPLSVLTYLVFGDVPSWITSCWNHGLELLFHFVDMGFTFSVVDHRTLFVSLGLSVFAYFICRRPYHYILFVLAFLCIRFHPWYEDVKMHLTQLDVGQGDSLLVSKDDRVEMVDAGPSLNLKPEKIIKRLAENGVTHVDTLLLSHLDDDHAGGLKFLLPWVRLGAVQISPKFDRVEVIQDWISKSGTVEFCSEGCFKFGVVDWIHADSEAIKSSKNALYKKTVHSSPYPIDSSIASTGNQMTGADHEEVIKTKVSNKADHLATYLEWYESGGEFDSDSSMNELIMTEEGNRKNLFTGHFSNVNRSIAISNKKQSKRRKYNKAKSAKLRTEYSGNDLMGIVMIPLSNHSIYVSLGDSNIKQEKEFWRRHHEFVEGYQNRYLKISHHGSHTSSDTAFLESFNPVTSVISVGKRNRYHHPHFSVLEKLQMLGLRVHRTDRDGDFHVFGD